MMLKQKQHHKKPAIFTTRTTQRLAKIHSFICTLHKPINLFLFLLLFIKFSHNLFTSNSIACNNLTYFFLFIFNSIRKERQFRTEQREEDGSVTGEYGYIDNDGKMHLTKYSASKAKGFKSEQIPVR